jgi:hypothetical protein
VGEDGQVILELHVEDAHMRAPEGAAAAGADDRGPSIRPPAFVTSTLESRLKVRSGIVTVAQDLKTGSKAGQSQTLILVWASTDEATSKDGK